jgi:hypothetical protein
MSWIKAARTAGLGLAAAWVVLLASSVQAPPLEAQSPAVEATKLQGCWQRDDRWSLDEPWLSSKSVIAFSVLCFSADQTAYHYSVAPFRGREERLAWQVEGGDGVVIDEQSCGATLHGAHLSLTWCLYTGVWLRQCTLMKEGGKGCARSLEPRALAGDRLHGCWRQDGKKGSFVELCFKKDQTIDRVWIEEDHGYGRHGVSDRLDWLFVPPDQLLISGQSCRVLPDSDDRQLLLSRCVFMGAWLRQPERPGADDAADPK